MAEDRSVVARLRAEASQFLATMAKAAKATEQVGIAAEQSSTKATAASKKAGDAAEKASKQAAAAAKKAAAESERQRQAALRGLDAMGTSALVVGGAITAGLGIGIKAFADFDEAMSSVNAALPEAGAKMEKLRNLAIDLGKDTQFSTTEAAQGITELAKAGVDADAILSGGLKGSLDLAAAGSLDVARAAEVSATALKQFNLQGSDLPHVADLYAAAAGKAQGSVEDIAQAMKFAGVTANGLGISLDETVGTLGLFADAGIIGEQAGTSLRSLLLSLTAPSEQAAAKMAELGISVYDAQGSFIGIGGAAQELQVELGKVDEATRNAALGTIFGNESINAARELYEGGATAIAKWTGKVNDAGFAAEQAAAKTDNLKGDVERLGGALDAVFVQNGEGANSALRNLTQGLESAVESFGRLPEPAQQTALGLAAMTGAGLLAAGVLAKVVTTGADLAESMEAIRTRSPKAAKGVDMATKATKAFGIAVAAVAVADALIRLEELGIGVEGFTKELIASDDVIAAIDKRFAKAAIFDDGTDLGIKSLGDALNATFDPSVGQRAEDVIGSVRSLWTDGNLSSMGVAAQRFKDIDNELSALVSSGQADEAARQFGQIAKFAADNGVPLERLKELFPQNAEALAKLDNEQKKAGGSAEKMAGKLEEVKTTAEDAQTAVDDMAEAIRGLGAGVIDVEDAQADFRKSIADAAKTAKDNAKAVKDGEMTKAEATAENAQALRDAAVDAKEYAAKVGEVTGSQDKAKAALQTGRDEFIKTAIEMDKTGRSAKTVATEAGKLADKYGLIPSEVTTTVKANGLTSTREKVQALIAAVELLNRTDANIGIRYTYAGNKPTGGHSNQGGIPIDSADGNMLRRTGNGMVRTYADGGVHTIGSAQPQIAKAGGAGILWAEEGAGPWEAFISGHPGKRPRSRAIAADTVERLGGRVEWRRFADGGMFGGAARGSVSRSTTHNTPVYVDKIVAADYSDFLQQAEQAKRDHAIGGGL